MIVYFSATGNCRYVAERMAAALDDTAVSIEDCYPGRRYELFTSTRSTENIRLYQ